MLGIFLDIETSGLDPKKHTILELAFKIVDVKTGILHETFTELVSISKEQWAQSDKASLQVNGLTWEMVSQGKPLEEIQSQVKILFQKHKLIRGQSVFICQNPSFDRSFFSQILDIVTQEKMRIPYHWLDLASMYWAYMLCCEKQFPWNTGFTKDKIAAQFHLPAEEMPHKAINGVNHLLRCYEALIGFPEASI